jgi:endoglucanase
MVSKFFFNISFLVTFLSLQLFSGELPFHRGVNLSSWLEQTNARNIQFTRFTKKDFQNIKSLGADVIRLPINIHPMTGGSPTYTIDPLLLGFIDEAVDWAEELGLHIILDNHSFDPAVPTSAGVWQVLVPVWKQMAEHFKHRSTLVYYEVLNEPHGINDVVWNAIQTMVIDSIRAIDTKHTIIVGPAGWNSYNNLNAMPVYADTNLIYTFHFYDPFIFTHQGASWTDPSLVPLASVPFPYDAARMPAVPAPLAGTWIQNDITNYAAIGNAAKVQQTLDIAVKFMNDRKVKLFCGEFGAFDQNSINEDRVRYYQVVRSYLEEKGIAWTSWDYQGGFGIFKKGSAGMFDHDLNVPLLAALGFTIPPQSIFTVKPDTAQFDLYTDYVGPSILQANYTAGVLDMYSSGAPFRGKFCINWKNASQYDHIAFDFAPEKDLSLLVNKGYWLSFRVKSSSPGLMFDVRFLDTKTGPADHPWRMSASVTGVSVAWDGNWHTYAVQLKNMSETGSWDSTWYNPAGLFDWKAVDRFEIVAEQGSLAGKELSLDDIRIVSIPAAVQDISGSLPGSFRLFQNYPNPFNPSTSIQYDVPVQAHVTVRIYSVLGQLVATLVNNEVGPGTHHIQWTADVSGGIYYCRMEAGSFTQTQKLVLMK